MEFHLKKDWSIYNYGAGAVGSYTGNKLVAFGGAVGIICLNILLDSTLY